MDDDLIWTCADIVRFTRDPDDEIRSWAWAWLSRHHPQEAGRQAPRGVHDPNISIALEALVCFEKHPTPEGVRAVEELNAQSDLHPPLREAVEIAQGRRPRPPETEPFTLEVERLAGAPEEFRRRATGLILSKSPVDHLLGTTALCRQQHRWATDFILDNFAALLTRHDDTQVWTVLGELRDPRSLPAILAAWVPTQRRHAVLYGIIHHLAGLTGPLPTGIARDIEEYESYREEKRAYYALHPGRSAMWPKTRRNSACGECGRTGEYERAIPVELWPLMPKRTHQGPVDESRVMVCKFCGARNPDRLDALPASEALGEDFDDDDDDLDDEDLDEDEDLDDLFDDDDGRYDEN